MMQRCPWHATAAQQASHDALMISRSRSLDWQHALCAAMWICSTG
jgi:hypothetical protein